MPHDITSDHPSPDHEARFASIVQWSDDAIYSTDPRGMILTWNPGAERLYGHSASDMVGRSIITIMPPDRRERDRATLDRVLAGERIGHFETRRVRADGSQVQVSISYSPIRDAEGNVVEASIIARPLGREAIERQRSAFLTRVSHVLHSSLDQTRTLEEVAQLVVPEHADSCAVHLHDADRRQGYLAAVRHCDPEREEQLRDILVRYPFDRNAPHGAAHVMHTGRTDLVEVAPADMAEQATTDESVAQWLRDQRVHSFICVPLVVRGTVIGAMSMTSYDPARTFTSVDVPFFEELGVRLALAVDNARLHERLARQLDASQELSRQVLDLAMDAFVSMDANGTVTAWNPQAEATFGWSADDAIGRTVAELIIPEAFRERHHEGLAHYLATGRDTILNQRIELAALHELGHELPIELTIIPVLHDGQHSFHAFLHDISERKQAQESLLRHKRELDDAQRVAGVGSWIWDVRTDEVTWSDELYRIHGLEPGSRPITLQTALDFIHPDDDAPIRENIGPLSNDDSTSSRPVYRVVRDDGTERMCRGYGEMVHDEHGKPARVIGIVQDITERVEGEAALARTASELRIANEQLEQSEQRIRSFFNMASHELRTPLTSISGFASTMLDRWDILGDADKRHFLEIVNGQSQRLTRLVNDLLTLSRIEQGDGPFDPTVATDVRGVIGDVLQILEVPDLTVDCPDGVVVPMLEDQLQQVLINYLANANAHGAPPVSIRVEAGESVTIRVCDGGEGVPAQFVDRLFEPFNQAGTTGSGSGLGLSIVRGLAMTYGGEAWYERSPDGEACFCVRLPATQQQVR